MSAAITLRRLTIQQAATAIGVSLGTLVVLRSKCALSYDPSFPPMTNGTFDAAEVMAWKQARDAAAKTVGGEI